MRYTDIQKHKEGRTRQGQNLTVARESDRQTDKGTNREAEREGRDGVARVLRMHRDGVWSYLADAGRRIYETRWQSI